MKVFSCKKQENKHYKTIFCNTLKNMIRGIKNRKKLEVKYICGLFKLHFDNKKQYNLDYFSKKLRNEFR